MTIYHRPWIIMSHIITMLSRLWIIKWQAMWPTFMSKSGNRKSKPWQEKRQFSQQIREAVLYITEAYLLVTHPLFSHCNIALKYWENSTELLSGYVRSTSVLWAHHNHSCRSWHPQAWSPYWDSHSWHEDGWPADGCHIILCTHVKLDIHSPYSFTFLWHNHLRLRFGHETVT